MTIDRGDAQSKSAYKSSRSGQRSSSAHGPHATRTDRGLPTKEGRSSEGTPRTRRRGATPPARCPPPRLTMMMSLNWTTTRAYTSSRAAPLRPGGIETRPQPRLLPGPSRGRRWRADAAKTMGNGRRRSESRPSGGRDSAAKVIGNDGRRRAESAIGRAGPEGNPQRRARGPGRVRPAARRRPRARRVRPAERRSCSMVLVLLWPSRGRHQRSDAAKISENGARTAEIWVGVRRYARPERTISPVVGPSLCRRADGGCRPTLQTVSLRTRSPPCRYSAFVQGRDAEGGAPCLSDAGQWVKVGADDEIAAWGDALETMYPRPRRNRRRRGRVAAPPRGYSEGGRADTFARCPPAGLAPAWPPAAKGSAPRWTSPDTQKMTPSRVRGTTVDETAFAAPMLARVGAGTGASGAA